MRLFGAGGRRWDAMFSRGERAVIRFLVRGLAAKDRRIHLKTALLLKGPAGQIILRKPSFSSVDRQVPAGKSTRLIETAVQLDLSRASPPGRYEATVDLTDAISGKGKRVTVDFQVVGPADKAVKVLTLRRFRAPPDKDLLAGVPLYLAFEVAGLGSRAARKPPATTRWHAKLDAEAVLRDGSGVVKAAHKKKLLDEALPFRPRSLPATWAVPLDAKLPAGSYHLTITVTDRVSGQTAKQVHRFKIAAGGLGIYGLRALGAGDVARPRFLRGERVMVHMHLRGWTKPADVALDVGLVGPDRGFYLSRKKAYKIQGDQADPGKGRELKVPLTIPEFAPSGRWVLKLRLRDLKGNRHATRGLRFVVSGKPLRPLPGLAVSRLVMRSWPSGPPVPGLLWRAGQTLYFEAVVGGMKLVKEAGYYHRAKLTCTLRLRDRAGKLKAELKQACSVDRRFAFVPLRLRLRSRWKIPLHLMGRHTFQFEVQDGLSRRVSVLQRGCFILIPRRTP